MQSLFFDHYGLAFAKHLIEISDNQNLCKFENYNLATRRANWNNSLPGSCPDRVKKIFCLRASVGCWERIVANLYCRHPDIIA